MSARVQAPEFLSRAALARHPVYCLTGPDEYLRECVLTRLRRELLDSGFADFNHQVLRCSASTKAGAVVEALSELPVMADTRLLELRGVDTLSTGASQAAAKALGPASRGGLVCVISSEEGGRAGKALLEAGAALGLTVVCQLDDKERPAWARAQLKRLGLQLDGEAMGTLLERTGTDLRLLAGQLEKLSLYAGQERRLSRAQVEELVPVSSEVQTWRLTAAIGQRKLPDAYLVLDRLLEQDEVPGAILSYLNSYLVSLVQVQDRYRELRDVVAVAKAVGRKSEFQVRKSLEEGATWSQAELVKAFESIARADLRIKTGSEPRLVLQLLVLQLCKRAGR